MQKNLAPENLKIKTWSNIKPYFEKILEYKFKSKSDLLYWLKQVSNLKEQTSEEYAKKYVKMTADTTNEKNSKAYKYYIKSIVPKLDIYANEINKKLYGCIFIKNLRDVRYKILIKGVAGQIKLFRKKNVSLANKDEVLKSKYQEIQGKTTINHIGRELTLSQSSKLLLDPNRKLRKEVYLKISKRRLKDKEKLNNLLTRQIEIRTKIALNSGFKNYRDYAHIAKERFDYSVEDVLKFHDSIEKEAVPLLKSVLELRKKSLGFKILKPWDAGVDINLKPPLKPFYKSEQLIKKTITALNKIDPFFGRCIQKMNKANQLDLESRKGKAPGGYNMPFYKSGIPFIFMNASGSQKDVRTIMHEAGHAIHSFLTKDLYLINFKQFPMEAAEFASMSMELFSMDYWNAFYKNRNDLKRAKFEQIEDLITTLPWIATIDYFQHLLYTKPNHSIKEREEFWNNSLARFSANTINWKGLKTYKDIFWQKQLHIFEAPFYYIEYAIAQLGAIAIWKNYKENRTEAIKKYKKALSLGYTTTLFKIYETAGIKFSFKQEYIKELMSFVGAQLKK